MAEESRSWGRQAATLFLLAGTLALTLSRAMRWPNDFAEAHWLLDYRFGFVKRGLPGQLLSFVSSLTGAAPSSTLIAAIAVALLATLCGTLLWMAWRIIRRAPSSSTAVLVALAFLSSPFIVMTAHLIGYYDHIVILLSVAAVGLMLAQRPWAAGAVEAVAILVHESAVLVGFPMLVLAWWVMPSPDMRLRARLTRAAALLIPLAMFAVLAVSQRAIPEDFQDRYSQYLGQYPFIEGDMHVFVPEWLTPGLAENVARQKHRFGERVSSQGLFGLVLPTALALLVWSVDVCRVRPRSITMALLIGGVFAPQLMHLAAWDTVRIWTYSIAMAWIGAWTLARAHARATVPSASQSGIRTLALVAIVANVLMSTPLLDNLADRYVLSTRVWMYAPVLAVAVALFLSPSRRLPADDAPALHHE